MSQLSNCSSCRQLSNYLRVFSSIIICVISINLQAQNENGKTSFLEKTDFKVGYYGNVLWDNGLNVGLEHRWKERIKVKKGGDKTRLNQLLLNGSLGYSTNFSNETDNGLYTYSGILWRRTNQKGRFFHLELNPLGYYRSFLPETYETVGNEVAKVRFPGRSYYAPSFSIGLGRQHMEKQYRGWYLNFNCVFRQPYNSATLPVFSLQFGHRFNFSKKN